MEEGPFYWLTLAISEQELAERLGCKPDEIEAQDYFGAIRYFGEIAKFEIVDR